MSRFAAALISTVITVTAFTALAPMAEATRYAEYSHSEIRPAAFAPAGHGVSFSQAHWSRWGKRKAVGRARLLVYDNLTGDKEYSRTTVILDRASHGLFRRVRWRYSNGHRGSSNYYDEDGIGRWIIQQ